MSSDLWLGRAHLDPRKRKRLEKQNQDKKRMKAISNVNIPQAAFIEALKGNVLISLVGTARCAIPGGNAAGRVAPALRARTAQRAVSTKLGHCPLKA